MSLQWYRLHLRLQKHPKDKLFVQLSGRVRLNI